MLVGCMSRSQPAEETAAEHAQPQLERLDPNAVRPVWRVGDSWLVRYQYLRGYWIGATLTELEDRLETLDWMYTVDSIDGDLVHISAKPLEDWGPLPWSFVFETSGRMVSAATIAEKPYRPGDEPLVDLRFLRYAFFVKEWPRFPLEEPYGREGDRLSQSVVSTRPGGRLTVSIVRQGPDNDLDVTTKRVMVQEWESGRPWWSSVVIRSESRDGTEKTDIEGTVISWTP
jgi:hypothetical protein